MIKKFTYPIPDELYVEGVSGKLICEYTYDGPEEIPVLLNSLGHIVDIEPRKIADIDENLYQTIDANANLPAAYMLSSYYHDDEPEYIYDYEDIEMENGDIYKKPKNPNLTDIYELRYDFGSKKWVLDQIIMELFDPSVIKAKKFKEYVLGFSEKYSFGEDIDNKIEEYLGTLQAIIDNPNPIMSWKYINIPEGNAPKIPAEIAFEFSKFSPVEE